MAKGKSTATGQSAKDDQPAVGPPLYVLLIGLVCVAVSMVLAFDNGFGFHMLGYVLATAAPILAVGAFRRLDLRKRISPFYVGQELVNRLIPVILVLGLLAAVVHTWSIATEWAS